MALLEVRTVTITEKGQIAIPKSIRENEGFKVGSKIALLAFKDRMELLPLTKFTERMATAMASEKALGKEWNSKEEDEAWKDL